MPYPYPYPYPGILVARIARRFSSGRGQNSQFYQDDRALDELCQRAGLIGCPDVTAVLAIIAASRHFTERLTEGLNVAEIGAGGDARVARALLNQDKVSIRQLHLVEREPQYLNQLRKRYPDEHSIVKVINADIVKTAIAQRPMSEIFPLGMNGYDVILAMWCIIYEINPDHRMQTIRCLYNLLNPGGLFMVDLSPRDIRASNLTHIDHKGHAKVDIKGLPIWTGWNTTPKEMLDYGKLLPAGQEPVIQEYLTDNGKARSFVVYQKG